MTSRPQFLPRALCAFTFAAGVMLMSAAVAAGDTQAPALGHLVYNGFMNSGSYIVPVDGSTLPRKLAPTPGAAPWIDGSRYLLLNQSSDKADRATVHRMASNAVIAKFELPRFVLNLRTSPTRVDQFLAFFKPASFDIGQLAVMDTARGLVLHRETLPDSRYHFDWLPGDRLLRVDRQGGAVEAKAVGDPGAWQAVGRIAVPAGFDILSADVNPAGTRLALVFTSQDPSTVNSTLWTANLDGSQLVPVVPNRNARWPAWSPDGRHIALLLHAEGCLMVNCSGGSSWWYLPANTVRAPALVHGVAHPVAKEIRVREGPSNFALDATAVTWTR